ncbi:MAG TPA: SUMF1/EgtB/PvdO family nonheme iron enzyme [Steroidobacteraceae bacterium]|nr:SUMF1/EgtB/PvdO family nonheme iron enzyme [Steroidobacteraceae bacterium]
MSADTADRLRALARDHLEGRSSRETYRRSRAQLLDGLLAPAAGASPDATQPRMAAQVSEATQPRAATPRATPQRSEPAQAPQPPPSGDRVRVGRVTAYVALVLLLTLAVGFFVWRHYSHGAASAAANAPVSAGQTDPLRALLEPLLQNPDWSDARLVALNQALLEAGQSRLDAARNTDWFDAFVASVRSRLLQQQALAGTPLTPDNSPLAALAVSLGIDLAVPVQPAASAAHLKAGPPAEVSQKSAERTKRPAGVTSGGALPPGKPRSSLSPAQASASASPSPASPEEGGAQETGPVQAKPIRAAPVQAQAAGAQGNPGSAIAPTPSQSVPAKTPGSHEHPACSAALSQARLNYCQDFLASGAAGPLLAVIPAGSFMMGNREWPAEGPAHRVTLSYGFAMSVYEVSQSEFQLYCRTAGKACPPQPWERGDDPVVNVSWRDAQDYAQWLSQATHQRYRLATEAEWEYAARAGAEGLYPSGDSLSPTDACFSVGTTLTAPAPRSMRFNANAWHLMHMVGNAREWVADDWSATLSGEPADGSARAGGDSGIKVVRGGCYADPAIKLRLTTREPLPADTRDRCTGIRLVRQIR